MPPKEVSKALIQRDVVLIRPSSITDKFSILPVHHPIEIVTTTKSKSEENAVTSYSVEPVLFINMGGTVTSHILGNEKPEPLEVDDVIYVIQGSPMNLSTGPTREAIENLEEAISISDVLDKMAAFILKYIDFQDKNDIYSRLIAIHILGSYFTEIFPAYPYLWIHGVKGTGKSRLLEIISQLSYYGIWASKISGPGLYRIIEGTGATVTIDEAENLWGPEGDMDLVRMLNAGYKRNGKAVLINKDTMKVDIFNVYGAKVLASIRGIEPTIESRSILMVMKRAKTDVDKLMVDFRDSDKVRNKLYKYRLMKGSALYMEFGDFEMTKLARELKVSGREYELFSPLIFLCQKFKPEWFECLKDYIVHYQEIKKTMEENTMEANVILALYNIIEERNNPNKTAYPVTPDKWEGDIGLHEISEMMMRLESDYANISTSSLGRAMQRLGFLSQRRICNKRYRHVEGKNVMDYLKTNEMDYQFKPRTKDELAATLGGVAQVEIDTYALNTNKKEDEEK